MNLLHIRHSSKYFVSIKKQSSSQQLYELSTTVPILQMGKQRQGVFIVYNRAETFYYVQQFLLYTAELRLNCLQSPCSLIRPFCCPLLNWFLAYMQKAYPAESQMQSLSFGIQTSAHIRCQHYRWQILCPLQAPSYPFLI